MAGYLTGDAISAVHEAFFFCASAEERELYAPKRYSLYWRLEEMFIEWEQYGIDTASLLSEFIQIMTERRDI